ncbi:MAG: cobalamin biosynthesis protein CobD [Acidobacteria bacterium]|nr:MAG: cobalamin biosynthesis protein CobD [Acidobacteriota bacterium]
MNPLRLLAAYLIDLALGDPENWPHPVRCMGLAIVKGEALICKWAKDPAAECVGGALLTVGLVTSTFTISRVLISTLTQIYSRLGMSIEVLLAWTTLATQSLLIEAQDVLNALDREDLVAARQRLSRIVGRDTHRLDESEICRALIETVAESACDGIIAPLTFLAAGGAPAAMAYKAVNTLDSMIGHIEPPYRYLGCVAARMDDAANLLPARLTALAIAGAALLLRLDAGGALRVWWTDGRKHPSPNAGQCEAAMAGVLGVQLGGLNYYEGRPSLRAYLAEGQKRCCRQDARTSLRVVRAASLLGCSVAVLWCVWRHRK